MESNHYDYTNEVRLAGLLHDIGKFYQKSGARGREINGIDVSGHHALISARFIEKYRNKLSRYNLDIDAIKEMVQRHHERDYGAGNSVLVSDANIKYKYLCEIINIADNISSSERMADTDISKGGHFATAPLTSIFANIGLVDGGRQAKQAEPVKTAKLGLARYPAGVFKDTFDKASASHDKNSTDTNEAIINAFASGFEQKVLAEETFNKFFDKLLTMLKACIWCYPSDKSQEISDVSLYDHLKTTSAIASILYNQLDKSNDLNLMYRKVKSIDNFALIRISINNPDEYISTNRDKLVQGLEFIEKNKKYVRGKLKNLVDYALSINRASTANIVIDSIYDKYILIGYNSVNDIVAKFNTICMEVSVETGMGLDIGLTTIEIPKSAMTAQHMYSYIRELNRVHENRGEYSHKFNCTYYGYNSILTSGARWVDSGKVFNSGTLDSSKTIGISTKVQNKVKEFMSGVRGNTFSLVNIKVLNIEYILDNLFKLQNESNIIEYDTISRVATANRMIIDSMEALRPTESILVSHTLGSITFVTKADGVLSLIDTINNRLSKMSFGVFRTQANIVTFKASDELEVIHKRLNTTGTSDINYNSKEMKWEDIPLAKSLMDSVQKTIVLNKSTVYKLREFIFNYYEGERSGEVSYYLAIPRFFNNKAKNFSNSKADPVVIDYVSKEFNKFNNGETAHYMLNILLELINDAISIEIRE